MPRFWPTLEFKKAWFDRARYLVARHPQHPHETIKLSSPVDWLSAEMIGRPLKLDKLGYCFTGGALLTVYRRRFYSQYYYEYFCPWWRRVRDRLLGRYHAVIPLRRVLYYSVRNNRRVDFYQNHLELAGRPHRFFDSYLAERLRPYSIFVGGPMEYSR